MDKLKLISPRDMKIDDRFWNRYLDLVEKEVIPYQWDILNDNLEDVETSHCIQNFRIAAGLEEGEFYGAVFQDTDVAKWLEAVAYMLMCHEAPLWERRADEVIELIGKAQWEDGYINTYYTIKGKEKRFTNLREGHELYTAGHMMEAAVTYYRATGKDRFLKIIIKFADLICDVFSEENRKDAYAGHQEVEIGLIKLYEVTGERKYLQQAKSFLERRGREPYFFDEEMKNKEYETIFPEFRNYDRKYSQSHLPIREQRSAEGHAVRATYMYSAMADVAAEFDDEELLHTCEQLWNNMVCRRMYITGSIGSSGILERFTTDYDLPNNSNYSETCASIGLAMFSRRMAQITGEAKYMDAAERALYNTLLSGIAMDGRSFFYVNPLEVWPPNCMNRTSKEHVKPVRQKWFGVACCPPNIARTLASLSEYVAFQKKTDLYLNLFLSMETEIRMNDSILKMEVKTEFPDNGKVEIHLSSEERWEGRIHLRLPDYVKKYRVFLEGEEQSWLVNKGYIVVPVVLGGKTCTIEYHMELVPRVVRSNPRVRENIGKVALMRGPVVYCLEEMDNGTNLPGCFLDVNSLQEQYREDILGGTLTIHGTGLRIEENSWEKDLLYAEDQPEYRKTELTFLPYGYWCNRTPGEMIVWVRALEEVTVKEV